MPRSHRKQGNHGNFKRIKDRETGKVLRVVPLPAPLPTARRCNKPGSAAKRKRKKDARQIMLDNIASERAAKAKKREAFQQLQSLAESRW